MPLALESFNLKRILKLLTIEKFYEYFYIFVLSEWVKPFFVLFNNWIYVIVVGFIVVPMLVLSFGAFAVRFIFYMSFMYDTSDGRRRSIRWYRPIVRTVPNPTKRNPTGKKQKMFKKRIIKFSHVTAMGGKMRLKDFLNDPSWERPLNSFEFRRYIKRRKMPIRLRRHKWWQKKRKRTARIQKFYFKYPRDAIVLTRQGVFKRLKRGSRHFSQNRHLRNWENAFTFFNIKLPRKGYGSWRDDFKIGHGLENRARRVNKIARRMKLLSMFLGHLPSKFDLILSNLPLFLLFCLIIFCFFDRWLINYFFALDLEESLNPRPSVDLIHPFEPLDFLLPDEIKINSAVEENECGFDEEEEEDHEDIEEEELGAQIYEDYLEVYRKALADEGDLPFTLTEAFVYDDSQNPFAHSERHFFVGKKGVLYDSSLELIPGGDDFFDNEERGDDLVEEFEEYFFMTHNFVLGLSNYIIRDFTVFNKKFKNRAYNLKEFYEILTIISLQFDEKNQEAITLTENKNYSYFDSFFENYSNFGLTYVKSFVPSYYNQISTKFYEILPISLGNEFSRLFAISFFFFC